MEIGCCCNMISTMPDGTGLEWAEKLRQIGYDYIELPLAQIAALDDGEFIRFRGELKSAGIACKACNNFFPGTIRLTGPNTQQMVIEKYVWEALDRAGALGAETVVFGSSGARNVPPGFSKDKALSQLAELLLFVNGVAETEGIIIAIEPLNRRESNIINTVTEGLWLTNQVDRGNIKLLADYYHLMVENDDLSAICQDGSKIEHVHLANPNGRIFPTETDSMDYAKFFETVRGIGYNRRISVEAYSDCVESDAADALACLKKLAAVNSSI